MTENKRFKLAFEDFDGWAILDTTGEYSDDEDYIDWLSGQKAVDVLNHFAEENEQLKEEVKYFNEAYSVQEYGLDIETHVQLSSSILSRKELLNENKQLKEKLDYMENILYDLGYSKKRKKELVQ